MTKRETPALKEQGSWCAHKLFLLCRCVSGMTQRAQNIMRPILRNFLTHGVMEIGPKKQNMEVLLSMGGQTHFLNPAGFVLERQKFMHKLKPFPKFLTPSSWVNLGMGMCALFSLFISKIMRRS